jgi:hypothetical protein
MLTVALDLMGLTALLSAVLELLLLMVIQPFCKVGRPSGAVLRSTCLVLIESPALMI